MIGEKCIVLGGRRGLDQESVRWGIGRIPEVSKKIREAQTLFDECSNPTDLYSLLTMSNSEYLTRSHERELLAAIVQVGLYQRHSRIYGGGRWFICNTNGVSPIAVLAGTQSFKEMIFNSPCYNPQNWDEDDFASQPTLTLAGENLEEYGLFEQKPTGLETVSAPSADCYQIAHYLQQDYQVYQFILLGPSTEYRLSLIHI